MNESKKPTTLERLQHWKAHAFDRIGLEYTAELISNAAIELESAEHQNKRLTSRGFEDLNYEIEQMGMQISTLQFKLDAQKIEYRSSCSGLWYRSSAGAGRVNGVKVNGVIYDLRSLDES